MHRMKTGALLKAAVLMGALSGHASSLTECTREALAQYGEAIGLAFQIVDDLLDVEASTAELGKDRGQRCQAKQADLRFAAWRGGSPRMVVAIARSGTAGSRGFRQQCTASARIGRLHRLPKELSGKRSIAGRAMELLKDSVCRRICERSIETQLPQLADELRAFVLESVSKTGGHLSSNLGTVELTIALHYVFNTPEDRLVWDVGHQTYPHKILTGRRDHMARLRQRGGMSGFPRRSESEYDTFGTAHSSTSISAALGMAVAARNQGSERHSIAVIGDGAMSAGMAFEALNNAGVTDNIRLLVILNDNDMSISPAVGGLNRYLARLMSGKFYATAKQAGKQVLKSFPPVFELAKKFEEHAKGMVVPGTMFEEFGFNYIGPIDGHDLDSLIPTLQNLKALSGPQFLHVVTKKGQGYKLAEADPVLYHGPTKFDPTVGFTAAAASKPSYTKIFGDWLCDMAALDHVWSASRPRCAKARDWFALSRSIRIATSTSELPSSTP